MVKRVGPKQCRCAGALLPGQFCNCGRRAGVILEQNNSCSNPHLVLKSSSVAYPDARSVRNCGATRWRRTHGILAQIMRKNERRRPTAAYSQGSEFTWPSIIAIFTPRLCHQLEQEESARSNPDFHVPQVALSHGPPSLNAQLNRRVTLSLRISQIFRQLGRAARLNGSMPKITLNSKSLRRQRMLMVSNRHGDITSGLAQRCP